MLPLRAGELDELQETFLERLEAHVERADHLSVRVLGALGARHRVPECLPVVADEVDALPVAFKYRADFVDDVLIARRGDTHVPFHPGDLRGVGQVGRAT